MRASRLVRSRREQDYRADRSQGERALHPAQAGGPGSQAPALLREQPPYVRAGVRGRVVHAEGCLMPIVQQPHTNSHKLVQPPSELTAAPVAGVAHHVPDLPNVDPMSAALGTAALVTVAAASVARRNR